MVEESLLTDDWTAALTANFLTMEEPLPSNSTSSSSSSAAAPSTGSRSAQGSGPVDKRLRFKSLITPFAGLFQWLKVPANANHSDWIYNQHLPHLYNMHAILGNCEEFCRLSLESSDEVSFPSLDKWIERLLDRLRQYSFRPKEDEKPRVVLILSDIDKQVTKLQKKVSVVSCMINLLFKRLTSFSWMAGCQGSATIVKSGSWDRRWRLYPFTADVWRWNIPMQGSIGCVRLSAYDDPGSGISIGTSTDRLQLR